MTTAPDTARLDKEELRVLVADTLDVERSSVTDEAHFMNDLGVDSLMALELLVVLERKYRVKLDESLLQEITCLRKAHEMLQARMVEAA